MKETKNTEKMWSIRDAGMCFCLGILVFLMLIVVLRFLTRQIVVEQWNIENAFTRLVFIGAEEMGTDAARGIEPEGAEQSLSEVKIDWKIRYPHERKEAVIKKTGINQWNSFVEATKEKISAYTGEGIIGYPLWIRLEQQYEKAIGWNMFLYNGVNEVVLLPDGYLTHVYGVQDVKEHILSVEKLQEFCSQQRIDVLYVQSPFKISKYQDAEFAEEIDFSNQNADNLLAGLRISGVPCLDIRESIEEEGWLHHPLFYRTDHHWKIETGLWASGVLARSLNEEFGFEIEAEWLEKEYFYSVRYPDWFLGSQGKKVTLEQTEPEDICLLYPKYSTLLHYEIPNLGVDTEGDFSVVYNMEQIKEIDYYHKNPYAAVNYGDCPVIQIENQKQEKGHVLFIKDSFVNCVAPFLALGVKEVDVLDIRHFDGSVKGFIEEKKPDIVIVMYNPSSIQEIDWDSHTSTFDFR